MRISFVGDIMLGRFIWEKYQKYPYQLISSSLLSKLEESDYVIANLESPITEQISTNSIAFAGSKLLLNQLQWVSCFSISNNHINDFGVSGINETLQNLFDAKICCNGLYKIDYEPFIIDKSGERIAIITCTDMMNSEFGEDCPFKTLRIGTPLLEEVITKTKKQGYFTILYAHAGSLFTRFPNPQIRDLLKLYVDKGADCIVTAHSHCLGGMEIYKGVPIFYSIGDFLMDGASYRRRQSCVLDLEINHNILNKWNITPTITTISLQTNFPDEKLRNKMLRSFAYVSEMLEKKERKYDLFYKYQYKKEIFYHSLSTLHFIYSTKGLNGLLKVLYIRIWDIIRMIQRLCTDRSKVRVDSDALYSKHKLTNSEIQ